MTTEPSPRELDRRIDDMRDEMRRSFVTINQRLDRVPTSELLMAHLQGWQQQLNTARDDLASLRVHVDTEIAEVRAEMKAEHEERKTQEKTQVDGRRWLIGVVALPTLFSILALAIATGVIG